MHVAMAALIAIAAWKVSRRLGALAWAFALLILVGSVQLGWHYAVDGYLSLLLVPPIWLLAGWISRIMLPREAGQA